MAAEDQNKSCADLRRRFGAWSAHSPLRKKRVKKALVPIQRFALGFVKLLRAVEQAPAACVFRLPLLIAVPDQSTLRSGTPFANHGL